MMTHKNRMLCGPPDWFYIITYIGNHGKTAELNLIGIDSEQVHTSIAKTIRSSCGFDRVESIIKRPGTADFVKKDYPLDKSYFENLY